VSGKKRVFDIQLANLNVFSEILAQVALKTTLFNISRNLLIMLQDRHILLV